MFATGNSSDLNATIDNIKNTVMETAKAIQSKTAEKLHKDFTAVLAAQRDAIQQALIHGVEAPSAVTTRTTYQALVADFERTYGTGVRPQVDAPKVDKRRGKRSKASVAKQKATLAAKRAAAEATQKKRVKALKKARKARAEKLATKTAKKEARTKGEETPLQTKEKIMRQKNARIAFKIRRAIDKKKNVSSDDLAWLARYDADQEARKGNA